MNKTLTAINVADLNTDRTYQRPLRKTYKKIAAQFDPLLLSTITVSKRLDGTYWILDGQHRVAAAKELGIPTLDALIYSGLTLEEEAYIFSMQNHNKIKVNTYELYHAGKLNRTSVFYTLDRVLKDLNLAIVSKTETGPRTIGFYRAKIEQHGTERLKKLFKVCKNCNKRYVYDLYNDIIQRAIYAKLETHNVREVTDLINNTTDLRTVIASKHSAEFRGFYNLI